MKFLWIFVALIVLAGVGWYVTDILPERAVRGSQATSQSGDQQMGERIRSDRATSAASASWSFDGSTWQVSGTPPECTEPLALETPTAQLAQATQILYPGQQRSTGYKTHGGFRFDDAANSDVSVRIPADGHLSFGSRYIEQGELQYFLFFTTECGIAYRFDHLLALSPKFQALVDTLPEAKVDDSRTTPFEPPVAVTTGETVATAVGFTGKTAEKNVSFDFGVYDLRHRNGVSSDPTFVAAHTDDLQFAPYGVCWFDLLSADDEALVRSLPAADPTSGKTSDYCK